MIGITHYLVLSAILFALSVMGIFLNRKNIIVVLMSIELMLLAVNFNFITFSTFLHNVAGQIFVFFTLTVAAAEAATQAATAPDQSAAASFGKSAACTSAARRHRIGTKAAKAAAAHHRRRCGRR